MGLSGWGTSNSAGSPHAKLWPHAICACCPASKSACQVHKEQQEPGSGCALPAIIEVVYQPLIGIYKSEIKCVGGLCRLQEGACSSRTTQALQDDTHIEFGWGMLLAHMDHIRDKLNNPCYPPGEGTPCVPITAPITASGQCPNQRASSSPLTAVLSDIQ